MVGIEGMDGMGEIGGWIVSMGWIDRWVGWIGWLDRV